MWSSILHSSAPPEAQRVAGDSIKGSGSPAASTSIAEKITASPAALLLHHVVTLASQTALWRVMRQWHQTLQKFLHREWNRGWSAVRQYPTASRVGGGLLVGLAVLRCYIKLTEGRGGGGDDTADVERPPRPSDGSCGSTSAAGSSMAAHRGHTTGQKKVGKESHAGDDDEDTIAFVDPATSAFASYVHRVKRLKEEPLMKVLGLLESAAAQLEKAPPKDAEATAMLREQVHQHALYADELLTQLICGLDGVPVRSSEELKQKRKGLIMEASALASRITPYLAPSERHHS